MRMGKLNRNERGNMEFPFPPPKFSSAGMVVGQVSSNLVLSIYLPLWGELAQQSMQSYINQKIEYDELMAAASDGEKQEAEVSADGETETAPPPPKKPAFHSQYVIDDFADTLKETAKHFTSKGGYKIHVNAAKFERQLDEKYGIFRPFVHKYPEIEVAVKSLQRKYAMGYFSPIRSQPPIARSTSVIILFMMHRQVGAVVSWQVLILAALFLLVGLQPWALVVLVAIGHQLLERRRRHVMACMDSDDIPSIEPYYNQQSEDDNVKKNKHDWLLQPVGEALDSSSKQIDTDAYDTILLGSGPGPLYTAALLSRAGRKVLVLSSMNDASGCLTVTSSDKRFKNIPFDIDSSNVSRVTKQQQLLSPALCTTTDYQGGIRFAQIGTQADGYAFEILAIPGMGTSKVSDTIPFILRANGGLTSLMDDTASLLGDGWPSSEHQDVGNSLAGAYVKACQSMNASASTYYQSKVLSDSANELRSRSTYQEAGIRQASVLLDQCFPLNAHLRSLFAGMGLKGENIPPHATSMAAHVTNVCAATSGEGMYYPVGGPRAICHALASVVEQCGGKVVNCVSIAELVFDKSTVQPPPEPAKEGENNLERPKCLGIKTSSGQKICFGDNDANNNGLEKVVISTSGFLDTFIRYMSPEIRNTYHVPRGLPALSERRPTWRALFALDGSAQDLDITGADYYRLPNASIAFDEVDPQTGQVKLGVVGGKDDDTMDDSVVLTEVVNDAAESSSEKAHARRSKDSKSRYLAGKSWMKVSFPSAKDPSFEERHGKISTCVVTIEVDDDFVTRFDTSPKVFSIVAGISKEQIQRVLVRVTKDLTDTFPQLEGKIAHGEMRGPFRNGLSHNPERFAAKGIRADTPYPNLFVGGSDLTLGDSFSGSIVSGWLTANAVVGYSTVDYMFLDKNITSDLARFAEIPEEGDDEDLAVDYTPPVQEAEVVGAEQAAGEGLESKKEQ